MRAKCLHDVDINLIMFVNFVIATRTAKQTRAGVLFCTKFRLQVVSNFGDSDSDCGVGEIHTHARAKFRGDALCPPHNCHRQNSRLFKTTNLRQFSQ